MLTALQPSVKPLATATTAAVAPSRGASGETVHFAGTAKASPFGRGVCAADGEGKPGTKEHPHSDKHWLLIESSYRCVFVLSQRPCPLSLTSFASSPKGGATGVSVRLPLDEQSTMSRKR